MNSYVRLLAAETEYNSIETQWLSVVDVKFHPLEAHLLVVAETESKRVETTIVCGNSESHWPYWSITIVYCWDTLLRCHECLRSTVSSILNDQASYSCEFSGSCGNLWVIFVISLVAYLGIGSWAHRWL